MRSVERWQIDSRDIGFMPEAEQFILEREAPEHRWKITHPASGGNPVESWLDAWKLSETGSAGMSDMITNLDSGDMVLRTWACIGLGNIGSDASSAAPKLKELLNDPSPDVQIEAARGLILIGSDIDDAFNTLTTLLGNDNQYVRLHAINRIDQLGNLLKPFETQLTDIKNSTSHWKIEALLGYTLESIDEPPQREPQPLSPVFAVNEPFSGTQGLVSPYTVAVKGRTINVTGPSGDKYDFYLFNAAGICVTSHTNLRGNATITPHKKPAAGLYTAHLRSGKRTETVKISLGR
ncbi:MAG: hypothetical protein GF401_15275 [Chitinivibrionales bacterium]|nr:hypothetical protein [Chitinivibrionales bacterium]